MKSASGSRSSGKPKAPPAPAAELWVCEGCGHVTEGINPPDACSWCEHGYFENFQDLEDAMDTSADW